MNFSFIILSFFIATSVVAAPVHLDLEMTSDEYRAVLKNIPSSHLKRMDDPSISEALKLGERLSKWIAKVNENRSADSAIRLTSAQTRRGIPIDKPNSYSPAIIKKETASIYAEVPKEITRVLRSSEELPVTIPMDDETFITHARRIDRNYQSAARFKSVDVYRSYYIQAATKDVRGYYYLKTNSIGEFELRDTAKIPANKLQDIRNALTLVCLNSVQNLDKCKSMTNDAFNKNQVDEFYKKHIQKSNQVWNDFFRIPSSARRKDINWSATVATVPFNTPEIAKFGPYLKDNIEDEFRFEGWSLKIKFGNFPFGPVLKFEPGVVPHVNGLGGNEIVMDSNQPIEEYESQWIIRHEFGHVLGLPDCYHEFYDTTAQAYVNYQLDITDLMCSRAGNMKERIYKELKKAYEK